MNKTFAESKILAVSGKPNNPPIVPPVNPFIPGQQGLINTTQFDAAAQASIGDLTN
jgi:hypothetical protein